MTGHLLTSSMSGVTSRRGCLEFTPTPFDSTRVRLEKVSEVFPVRVETLPRMFPVSH